MLFGFTLTLFAQAPQCELPPHATTVTMRQPLRLLDGSEFGALAPKNCFYDPTPLTASGVIEHGGSTRATFQSGGFTVSSTFTPLHVFPKNGIPIPIRSVERTPDVCTGLALMPPVELPTQLDVIVIPCGGEQSDIDDRWVQCVLMVDLYVGDARTRRERVGTIDAETALIKIDEFSGWTQVSPFDPIPFHLNDGWYWWVHTTDLKGCRQPR